MSTANGNPISFGSQGHMGHIITIAPTRSGKGRDVLIPALLCDRIGAAVVNDPKCENAAVTARQRRSKGRRVLATNPFGIHTDRLGPPAHYNPLATLDPKSVSFEADCDSNAQAIISSVGKEPHWTEAARELWSGATQFIRAFGEPQMQHLGAVRALIAGPLPVFKSFIKDAISTGVLPIMERLSRFADLSDDDREARGILSTAKTQSAFLSIQAIRESLSSSDFTVAELRDDPITTVFNVIPGEYTHTCYAYNRLIMESAMRELMHRPAGNPVLFLIDEMPMLQRMEILETAIAMGAGMGIRVWSVAQDIHQLKKLYPETWQSFLANAGAQQWFAPREEETAEYLSKRCGQRTVLVKNTSTREISKKEASGGFTGISHSYAPQPRPLFLPQEILAMRGDRQLLFLDGVENVIVAGRRPYWEIPELKGTFDPNPFIPRSLNTGA